MKFIIPLLLALLGLWIVGSMYLQKKNCCCVGTAVVPAAASSIPGAIPLLFKNGCTQISLSGESLCFAASDCKVEVPTSLSNEYQKVAAYLKQNLGKSLTITGKSSASETNKCSSGDLGLARAESLKQYFVGLGINAAQIKTISAIDASIHSDNGKVCAGICLNFNESMDNVVHDTVFVKDAAMAAMSSPSAGCAFAPSVGRINNLTDDLKGELHEVIRTLKNNPNKAVMLVGNYCTTENNKSPFSNIGIARANSVRSALVAMGAPACQISISSAVNCPTLENVCFENGCTYKYEDASATQAKLAQSEAAVRGKVSMFCFPLGSSSLRINNEQKGFFKDLAQYMSCYPDARIIASGFGNTEKDGCCGSCIGKDRAEFLKRYLKKHGINPDKIITSGEDVTGMEMTEGNNSGCVRLIVE